MFDPTRPSLPKFQDEIVEGFLSLKECPLCGRDNRRADATCRLCRRIYHFQVFFRAYKYLLAAYGMNRLDLDHNKGKHRYFLEKLPTQAARDAAMRLIAQSDAILENLFHFAASVSDERLVAALEGLQEPFTMDEDDVIPVPELGGELRRMPTSEVAAMLRGAGSAPVTAEGVNHRVALLEDGVDELSQRVKALERLVLGPASLGAEAVAELRDAVLSKTYHCNACGFERSMTPQEEDDLRRTRGSLRHITTTNDVDAAGFTHTTIVDCGEFV